MSSTLVKPKVRPAQDATAPLRQLDSVSFQLVMQIMAWLGLLILTAPTIIVLLASFSSSATLQFPPPGFSLQWYLALFNFPELRAAALKSFHVALVTAIVCVVLGVSACLAMISSKGRWVSAMDALVMSPLALPGVALGLGMMSFFAMMGVRLSLFTLIVGHIVICTPYVVRNVLASLTQLGSSLQEASMALGANPAYTFFKVTLPLIKPGVLIGAFMAFLTSFDNVAVTLFLSDARTEMLPIRMWSMIENDLDVRAAAISGVLIFLTALLMIVMEKASGLSKALIDNRAH
jgi:putative spermidine/putrescine transport system permease protein